MAPVDAAQGLSLDSFIDGRRANKPKVILVHLQTWDRIFCLFFLQIFKKIKIISFVAKILLLFISLILAMLLKILILYSWFLDSWT